MFGRNFFANSTQKVAISIINDDTNFSDITNAQLQIRIVDGDRVLCEQTKVVGSIAYYGQTTINEFIKFPNVDNIKAQLQLVLKSDSQTLSFNTYDITIASKEWAIESNTKNVFVYKSSKPLEMLLSALNISYTKIAEIETTSNTLLIINGKVKKDEIEFLQNPTCDIVWLKAKEQAIEAYPEQITKTISYNYQIISMLIPESKLFNKLQLRDLDWFGLNPSDNIPYSSTGGYNVNWEDESVTVYAESIQPHGYLTTQMDIQKYWSSPLVSVKKGNYKILLCDISTTVAVSDSLALKLFANIFNF
jgi:hypothetical protein